MTFSPKPYAEAADQNKDPILAVLQTTFTAPGLILEIGSGTGQHVVHFARHLPHLRWQPTDRPGALADMQPWLDEARRDNILPPLALDVTQWPWPLERADGVYSANTVHIMGWPQVEALFAGVGRVLAPGSCFCLYGPFSYGGRHTGPGNARFDQMLRLGDPRRGVRDFDDLERLARQAGLNFEADHPMPVNNRTLVWRRG